MSLDVGDTKRLRLSEIKDAAGALIDPGVVELLVRSPLGAETTSTFAASEIERTSKGSFFFDLPLTEEGVWEYKWTCSGGVDLVERGTLVVGPDALALDPFPGEQFTVGDIWARSVTMQARYPKGSGDGDFALLVAVTAPLVGNMTGRAIAGTEGEEVTPDLLEIARRVIAMKTEQFASALGSQKDRKRSLNRGNLSSFSAGSYSESYFGPDQAMRAQRLDADPILAELMWALCTEQKRAEWLAQWEPENFPAGVATITSFDYSNRPNYGR